MILKRMVECKMSVLWIPFDSLLFSGVHTRVVFQKGGFGGCSPGTRTGTRVHSDVPPERKLERGYVRMFPRKRKLEQGYIRQTILYETALLSPGEVLSLKSNTSF